MLVAVDVMAGGAVLTLVAVLAALAHALVVGG